MSALDKRNLMTPGVLRGAVVSVTTLVLIAISGIAPDLWAQDSSSFSVAETISVAEPEVAYGDIILYDEESGLYRLSQFANDPRFHGIVVEDATLLVETDPELVPVVESGHAPVNVTLENGDINIGDPIVTASTLGKAMLASTEGEAYVFGFALESLAAGEGVEVEGEDGTTIEMGTIMVEVGGTRLLAYEEKLGLDEGGAIESLAVAAGKITQTEFARYSFAALVALGSIFVTFYTFLSSIRSGVISIGRNPRAKASIRSMVILNVVLALIITTIGIFFAISLLVLPDQV